MKVIEVWNVEFCSSQFGRLKLDRRVNLWILWRNRGLRSCWRDEMKMMRMRLIHLGKNKNCYDCDKIEKL